VPTATPARPTRRLESIQNAADYLGVNPKTIRRHIAAGRLTGYRAGPRLIRVDLNELDAMLRPIPTAGGQRHAS
jgi:excisionase family DNA binding protein